MLEKITLTRTHYMAIKELSKENKGEVYDAILEFCFSDNEVELSGVSKMVFMLIKPELEKLKSWKKKPLHSDVYEEKDAFILHGKFSIEFKTMWDKWREYKRTEYKFTYKSIVSETTALENLWVHCGGDEQRAAKMVNDSIGCGWSGIHEKNGNKHKSNPSEIVLFTQQDFPSS